ncbi:MFS transporter [Gammaproteobacteria bacterium]|jgi:MFS family permease|nr:MFS transporter [Gammaproteobacteria bacterium]|tara:strand:+ start:308 stop:1618 length:1311 start_codon:yes stop_codon:yes gene_type:complete
MNQPFISLNFLPKKKFKIDLVEGVTKTNFFSICYGALTTIGLLTFISYATTYVLLENLAYERDNIGTIVGNLQVIAEIALLCVFLPIGLLADKIGRRPVYSFGMFAMGLSYFLYPLATGIGELTLYRVIYAVGMGCATGMLGTVTADYPQNHTRGKMIAVTGILNGIGVIIVSLVFAKLPETFADNMDLDQITAGKYAMWVVAGTCLITSIVVAFGLKKGTPTEEQKKIPYIVQIKAGLAEGKNPRILLAYAAAFVARSDLVILGTFLVLWGITAGVDAGMTTSEAQTAARILFVTSTSAALIASPIIGYFIDKTNRIIAVSVCMAIAATGYLSMFFVDDIFDATYRPLFMLLGVGQQCAFFAATTLLGQEAPVMKRGAVVGVFNLAGALGILISSFIGGRIFDSIGPSSPFIFMGFCNIFVCIFAVYVNKIAPSK